MRNLFFLLVFLCVFSKVKAQEILLQHIKGLPTEEVYDLLADKKGFIWIAHSLGLTRFDGTEFKSFHNPIESGSGVTDLLEDRKGRIWFHNFNGQIFYIENEKMYLLQDYKYTEETEYPRLALLGDELMATTEKGLFICNTSNLQCKYLYNNTGNVKTRSFATVGKMLYQYDGERWLRYSPETGIHQIPFVNKTNKNFINVNPVLQPIVTLDTIYSKFSKGGIYKFIIRNDTVVLVAVTEEKDYVNTIKNYNNEIWIHTKKESYTATHTSRIENFNLTNIVTDREGNTWYSSLEKGLWIKPKFTFWKETSITKLQQNDFVRCFEICNKNYVYGTQQGAIIIKDPVKKTELRYKLPSTAGSVENLFPFSKNELLIAPSVGLYLINFEHQKLYELSKESTVKSIAASNNILYVAYSRALATIDTLKKNEALNFSHRSSIISDDIDGFSKKLKNENYIRNKRCYALCFDSSSEKIWAAFKDGLFTVNNHTCSPFLFKNMPITALSITSNKTKLLVGTVNQGIFIIDKKGCRNINVTNGLLSDNILRIKLIEDHLFIIEPNNLQLLDVNTEKIINTFSLPANRSGIIYDLWKEDSIIYLACNNSLYSISNKSFNTAILPVNYLLAATANDSILSFRQTISLPYFKNSVQFKIAAPSFILPDFTYFKYRLYGSNDTAWKQTNTNERNISFSALKPGRYRFEAYAVNFQNKTAEPIIIPFQINKPWWQQWWFYVLILICFAILVYYLVMLQIRRFRKNNRQIIEQLNLKNELRNSLLSTIKAQMNPHFIFNSLNTIQSFIYQNDKTNANKYLGKFSELVRKVLDYSTKQAIILTDEIELLQLYLDLEKVRFGDHLHIQFIIADNLDSDFIQVPPMLIQPYIENAIVHGLFHKKGKKDLLIEIKPTDSGNYIEIRIDDNGIGRELSYQLNQNRNNHISFATSANEKRIELINQTLQKPIKLQIIDKKDALNNVAGTLVVLLIPITNTVI